MFLDLFSIHKSYNYCTIAFTSNGKLNIIITTCYTERLLLSLSTIYVRQLTRDLTIQPWQNLPLP